MSDMLVKLYDLPEYAPLLATLEKEHAITIRPLIAAEKHLVENFARDKFSPYWGSEVAIACSHQPIGCFIAVHDNHIVGFACINATMKGFFGPTGVLPEYRGKNIGAALCLYSMHKLKEQGYGYGIIGGVGPKEFYAKIVGATEILDSTPGVYKGLIRVK